MVVKDRGERLKMFTNNSNVTTIKTIGVSSAISALLVLSSVFVAVSPMTTAAFAQTAISCGDTITKSTTLTSDIGPCSSVDGLIIGADNIILNCNGHTIAGSGTGESSDAGMLIDGHSGVTISNCKVTGFVYGFLFLDSSYNTLSANTASNNRVYGFDIDQSDHNILKLNTASNNKQSGFDFDYGSYNTLSGNTARNNHGDGFYLGASSSNTLTANTARNNHGDGFEHQGHGFELEGSSYNTLSANTASYNGANGFYLYSVSHYFSQNNLLQSNRADTNQGLGYKDTTEGAAGTARTANMYRLNECSGNAAGGALPTGLCRPQS